MGRGASCGRAREPHEAAPRVSAETIQPPARMAAVTPATAGHENGERPAMKTAHQPRTAPKASTPSPIMAPAHLPALVASR